MMCSLYTPPLPNGSPWLCVLPLLANDHPKTAQGYLSFHRLKNCDFRVTPDDPWGPLGRCSVIIW